MSSSAAAAAASLAAKRGASNTESKLEDTNMADYGSRLHRTAAKQAAHADSEFVGAGTKPGLEIWRVENKRSSGGGAAPDFGVKRWPKANYGSFYSGDSYIVLNTYRVKPGGDRLAWDVHFWLGKMVKSKDDVGVVGTYKTVELDDLLDDGPVQHREQEGSESALFLSYFEQMTYMEGGVTSGFRHVKQSEYVPRLFRVRESAKTVRAFEVPVSIKSLNLGDTFILDLGSKVVLYVGPESSAFEKGRGGAMAHNLVSSRLGKAKLVLEPDAEFWRVVGGTEAQVQPAVAEKPAKEEEAMDVTKIKLFQLTDRIAAGVAVVSGNGMFTFTKVGEGKLSASMLNSNDVFIMDAQLQLFVWVGRHASQAKRTNAMKFATEYIKRNGRPETLPVTRISEGQLNHHFASLLS